MATKETLPAAVERTHEVEAALEHGHDEELEAARQQEEAFKDLHERRAMRVLERVRDAAVPDPEDRADVQLTAVEGIAGPALVQSAIGQKYSAEELGGAKMHSEISGTVDFHEPTDEACLARIRSLVEKIGYRRSSVFDRKKPEPPVFAAEELYGIFESDPPDVATAKLEAVTISR